MQYKIHKSLIREFKDRSMFSGSLCRRLSSNTKDGYMNVTKKDSEVTCKFCLKILKKK